MADLDRGGSYELIIQDDVLMRKHREILVNEKLNLLKQLDVRLDHIQNVEVKQLQLKKEAVAKEIEILKAELNNTVINGGQ